jgi:hypothetical protein
MCANSRILTWFVALVVAVVVVWTAGLGAIAQEQSPEQKKQSEEMAAFKKELATKTFSAAEGWAKKAEWDKLGKALVEYAKSKGLRASFIVRPAADIEGMTKKSGGWWGNVETQLASIDEDTGRNEYPGPVISIEVLPNMLFSVLRVYSPKVDLAVPVLDKTDLTCEDVSLEDTRKDLMKDWLPYVTYAFPKLGGARVSCKFKDMTKFQAAETLLKTHGYAISVECDEGTVGDQMMQSQDYCGNVLYGYEIFSFDQEDEEFVQALWGGMAEDKAKCVKELAKQIEQKGLKCDFDPEKCGKGDKVSMYTAFCAACIWILENPERLNDVFLNTYKAAIDRDFGKFSVTIQPVFGDRK